MTNPLLPVAMGLAAAAAWGAGDFVGGVASRRVNAYGVVIGAQFVGLISLLTVNTQIGEPVPQLHNWLLAGLAGLCGGSGLTLLYRALANGQMSIAASLSAVVAAAIPVFVSALFQGFPGLLTAAGLAFALAAIWLISYNQGSASIPAHLEQLRLPFSAGIFFALFFILIHQASQDAVLWPIIATRISSVIFLVVICIATRQPWLPSRNWWPLIALSGLLDTGGNAFYILAGQFGRLDVAAVLSSLYPGATIFLAWLILKEHITARQMVGVVIALLAIVLISV